MKNTDLRAKARAIFGSAVAEPMPNQPNGAKALQQRANARPIPTYKVGGPVKKMPMPGDSVASGNRMSKMEADESRFMDMLDKKKKMPSARDAVDSGNRMSKMEGAEMRKMKMAKGGKAGRYADGGNVEENEMLVTGMRPRNVSYNMPPMGSNAGESMGSGMQAAGGSGSVPYAPVAPRPTVKRAPPLGIRSTAGYTGPTVDVGEGRASFGKGPGRSIGVGYGRQFKKGGKVQTSADTAEKLATEMGGMKKGGKAPPKSGLAVMIAIGKPMKPTKKMNGGPMAARSMDMESSKVTRQMAGGGDPMGYAAGGAGKTRKGQAPIKKAQGGGIGGPTLPMGQKAQGAGIGGPALPMGQTTAAYGASLRNQIKAGTMTNAQAQAAHNAFVKQEMARRTEAARVPVAVLPKGMPTPPTNDPGGVSAAHVALGKQLQAQIASGQITTAQARDTLNKNSPALRQLADMKAKSQAAAATAGNLLGALRPGVTSPSMGGVKPGMTAPKSSMTPPKSSAPYMPTATAPTGPAPAGPATTPAAAMRIKKGGKVSKPVGNAKGDRINKPIKKAQGGAAKVRKGMMTPEGNITHAMNKIRG
jgi:hypothetical protein